MNKAGGILGILAGVFGTFAAVATLFIGGMGAALEADKADTVIGLGWGGVFFSFLVIVFGAVAFAKPKGGGQGLILSSILGAILGGTLVAICMVMALVAGILALAGAKKVSTTQAGDSASVSSEVPAVAAKKKTSPWAWGALALVVVAIFAAGSGKGDAEAKEDPIAALEREAVSNLRPDGELAALFAFGGKGTDVQRENKLREIKGSVVQWTLPVFDVKKHKQGYKIQTETKMAFGSYGNNLLGAFVYVVPQSDADRQFIEGLATGDKISFKGRIDDVIMRSFVIEPAVLVASQ